VASGAVSTDSLIDALSSQVQRLYRRISALPVQLLEPYSELLLSLA
jgi:hypothetical protein